jgi:hypothetical protein
MTASPPEPAWVPDRLLRGLLAWTAVTTLVFWLPTVRGAFDGDSYVWGLVGLGGHGTRGAYWFPLAGTIFALGMQALGWRGTRFPFHLLLAGWHLLIGAGVVYLAVTDPEGFRFQGDTLGIPAVLAVGWGWRDLRRGPGRPAPPWQSRNRRWLAALVLLLPIQFVLLRFGPPSAASDQIGVLLTIVQWLLVGRALRPYAATG